MAAADEKLSAGQRSKIRRLAAPKELAADEEGGELNIVPFLDIVMNVLMFVLATVSVTFTATIDTFPPRAGSGARAPTTPTLGLTVLVVPDGFSMKARGGNVAPKRLFEDHLFGLSGDVGSNAVEVYVHRLRKMLADSGATVKIHTVRGVGYLMAEDKTG